MIYATTGINWEFLYEVLYEDADILVLKDLGRFHRFDQDRMWTKPIDSYIELYAQSGMARVGDTLKLVEVQKGD